MKSWSEFSLEAPELAEKVWERFSPRQHFIMATVSADGSPRLSGTELIWQDGQIYLAMMANTLRAADLRRNPTISVHSSSAAPEHWKGDAKFKGIAIEITDPNFVLDGMVSPGPKLDLFRIELEQVTDIRVGEPADHLHITWWAENMGVRTIKRL